MTTRSVMQWIAGNDTGSSSKAIWSHMMTGDATREVGTVPCPADADDFGRCYRLLAIAPEWEAHLGEMGRYSAEWLALAARWPELNALYEEAVDEPTLSPRDYRLKVDKAAWRKLRDVMHELLTKARVCADCGRVGMNGWTTYPNDVKRCSDCAEKYNKKHPRARSASSLRLGGATLTFGP